MKKLIIIIILVLILVLTGITVIRGIQIGDFSLLGIIGIQKKNNDLDTKLQEATKLASTDYKSSQKNLDEAIKKLQEKKEELEEKTNNNTEDYLNGNATTITPYKIDYLWVTIGNHAKVEGVTMKMDTSKNGKEYAGNEHIEEENKKLYYYDISFTVTGNYVNIAEFIIDIEDDSSLGFKIEEFNMKSSDDKGSIVQATFKCKDILIQGASSDLTTPANTSNTNNENNSNAISGNNTTNTNAVDANNTAQ